MTSSTEAMDPFIIEDDLMNIEYGDLLSMVKNLTQSRAAIKSKQKEITRLQSLLKEKATETSELTSKCAELDALKAQNEDLSIKNDSLNSEINRLKSETKDLVHVNKELESALHNQSKNEATHAVNICQIHNEFRMLFEKYVALEQLTHQFDTTIAQEKADKTVLQSRIIVLESKLNDLIKENFNLVDQLNIANRRIVACDGDLAHASNQLYDLSLELSNLDKARRENEERKWSSSWEVELLNADISRLLHLIAHFPTAAPFLLEWQSAHRLAYIGDYDSHTVEEGVLDPHDSSYPHSRRYNEEAHATYWHDAGFRSSAELSHLCRVYGSSKGTNEENRTIEAELKQWVPFEAANDSLQFFERHFPHISRRVVASFLGRLNKVWRAAERRKLRRVKADYEAIIADLRRHLCQSKPYESVMAVRQVKLLKCQLREERVRTRQAYARRPDESIRDDWIQDNSDELSVSDPSKHEKRLCREVKRLENILQNNRNIRDGKVTIDELAAKSLLEASLISLDILSQKVDESRDSAVYHHNRESSGDGDGGNESAINKSSFFRSKTPVRNNQHNNNIKVNVSTLSQQIIPTLHQRLNAERILPNVSISPIKSFDTSTESYLQSDVNTTTEKDDSIPDFYHRDPFLQGAIWLSRNISVTLDELYMRVEELHADCLSELTSILELRRVQIDREKLTQSTSHRKYIDKENLTEIEDAHWNDALIFISRAFESESDEFNNCRQYIRQTIEDAASIQPGDRDGLKHFIANLPVERGRNAGDM